VSVDGAGAVDAFASASFEQPTAPASFSQALQRSLEQKHAAEAQVEWAELRAAAHRIKAEAIEQLDRLLVQFEERFEARGGKVVWARSAEEACAAIIEICRRHGVRSLVKGKTMVSEEIELNHALAQAGIDAVETDLGEFIVQLAGQRPSHIVGPALHLSRADIGALFARRFAVPFSDDPHALLALARAHLRERYLRAGAGLTGVNFAAADTGSAVVVENEGNGGLSAAVPPVHILLMGIEKVLPRFSDLPIFLRLLARAGTGQRLTTYTHHFLGAEPGKHVYCVIVDAGRTRILADPRTRESLYCIRCGACLNVCPVYRRAGGWAYHSVYSGPIGAVIAPQLQPGPATSGLPFASTLCGACKEECPVDIDLPHQLVYLRQRAVAAPPASRAAAKPVTNVMRWFAWAMRSSWRYRVATAFARFALRGAKDRRQPPALASWLRYRSLPALPAQSFKTWWRKRKP